MQTHSLKINGMSGEHCVLGIKNIVGKIVSAAISPIEVGRADTRLDNSKTSKAPVVSAVEKWDIK